MHLIVYTGYCQGSNTSLKPYFYGKVQDSTVYCFTFTQTKAIASYVTNSIYCDSIDSLQVLQVQERDLVIKELNDEVHIQISEISKYIQILDNKDKIIDLTNTELTVSNNIITKQNRRIKILKIERVLYPAIAIIGGIYLSLTLRN